MLERFITMTVSLFVRGILLTLLCGGMAVWAGLNAGEGDYMPALYTAGALAWFILLQFRPLILAAAILCHFGHLTLPGVPEQLNLSLLAGLYFLPLIPLHILSRRESFQGGLSHLFLLGYALWLLVLISVHGLGLLQLGGNMIGGADYIRSFAAFGFFFACLTLPIPAHWWPRILAGGFLLLIPPTLTDIIIQFKPDFSPQLLMFMDLSAMAVGLSKTNELANADYFNRFVTLAYTSMLGTALVFCFRTSKRILSLNQSLPWLVVLLFLIMGNTLAGSREALFNLLVFVVLILLLDRALSPATLIFLGATGTAGLLFISVFFVQYLPLSIQRVFSALPWAKVDHLASVDAEGTWSWRKQLWALGWDEIPSNLLVGKGFSYDYHSYAFGRQTALDWAFLSSSYHMSHLDFLIKTGLPGLLLFYGFLVLSMVRHWKLQKSDWNDARLKRYHLVFLALFYAGVASFMTLYGDTGRSIVRFMFYVGILEALIQSDRRSAPAMETAASA